LNILKILCLYALGTGVYNWWDNGENMFAFCRSGKGFIAFNYEYGTDLMVTLQVNLTTKPTFELHCICGSFQSQASKITTSHNKQLIY
jgi:hypothetical protein